MQFAGTSGDWTDVSADVVRAVDITGDYGMQDAAPTTRVAGAGSMTFVLDNSTNNSAGKIGYYSPGHTNCRSGFQTGITVRLIVNYDSIQYVKFYGRIPGDGIKIDDGLYGSRRVNVEVRDFMEQAAIHDLYLPELVQNKRIDDIVPLINANMKIQPLSTLLNVGDDTFGAAFDTVRQKTRALTEYQKLALSELGYIYSVPDNQYNECLVVEGRSTRYNSPTVSTVTLETALSGYLLKEDAGHLLLESGGKIILNQQTAISLDGMQTDMNVSHGAHLTNIVQATVYPRLIDSSPVILFSLSSPIKIAAGETKTGYNVTYKDPTNRIQTVCGKNMIDPVATTDYLMNTLEDGTGTDKTANLAVNATYGVEGATYTLTNSSASDCYITKLNARGIGIYIPDPVTYIASDDTSELTHGAIDLSMDLKYQDDPDHSALYANINLNNYKDPKTVIEDVSFFANRSTNLMYAFLQIGIGDRVHLSETVSGVDGDYFIQGTSFNISAGDVINFKWIVKDATKDIYAFAIWDTSLWDLNYWSL
jgi:hypothetical protein